MTSPVEKTRVFSAVIGLLIAIRILGVEGWGVEIPPADRGLLALGWGSLTLLQFLEGLLQLGTGSRRASVVPFLLGIVTLALALPGIEAALVEIGSPPGVGYSLAAATFAALAPFIRLVGGSLPGIFRRTGHGGFLLLPLLLLGLALSGSVLLSSPKALVEGSGLSYGDTLFTAISASTVTGLQVCDPGTTFTPFGAVILLLLIQLGGLGVMSVFALVALSLGGGLGIRQGTMLRELLEQDSITEVKTLLSLIIKSTLLIELLGALALLLTMEPVGPQGDHPLLFSLFHAVSAFCNAGFTLSENSLSHWAGSIPVLSIFSVLIIVGGLGFPVTLLLWKRWRTRLPDGGERPRSGPMVKIVLVTSSLLIIGGWIALVACGGDGLSLFHAICARTAGFSATPIGALPAAAALVLLFLMFVGASPGSTGGGVKTVAVALLFLAVRAELRGESEVRVSKRSLPEAAIRTAAVVISVSLTGVLCASAGLLLTESESIRAGQFLPLDLIFEAVSAFATVGLSRGVTPELSDGGRLIVQVTMVVGRIGPLALVLLLGSWRRHLPGPEVPEGKVLLG